LPLPAGEGWGEGERVLGRTVSKRLRRFTLTVPLSLKGEGTGKPRTAGARAFWSAVTGRGYGWFADWQSAIQQVGNLRYEFQRAR
ncbi:MAG: hypothetical protein RMK20_09215, partial [Verrucomicrobiales bacterium]|nr:hypothetical protein [Verrucomicrobiales bacterium]